MGAVVAGPLVGRDEELERLHEALAPLVEGTGAAALVTGAAGIGKTRLLDELAAGLDPTYRLVRAAGDGSDRLRSFGLLLAVAAGLPAAEGTRLDGAVAAGVDTAVLDAAAELLEEAAVAGPVVLLLDDLHRADAASLLVLRHLPARLGDVPVAVVAALRPPGPDQRLDGLLAEWKGRGALVLELAGLDRGAVDELARAVLRGEPGARLLAGLDRAGGSPFLVHELLGHPEARGSAAGDDPAALLADVVRSMLRDLPPPTVEALELASVAGPRFELADLAALAGRPAGALYADLRPALAAGTVVERDGQLAFTHDLVQEALHGGLPATVRRSLHHDLGLRLARSGGRSRAAAHLLAGAEAGDDETAGLLAELAASASSLDVAADLWVAALDLLTPANPDRPRVATNALACFGMLGRADAARALADRHLPTDDADLARALHHGLLKVASELADSDAVMAHAAALEELGGLTPALRCELDAYRATNSVLRGDGWERTEALAAGVLADPAAEPLARVLALQARCSAALLRSRPEEAVDLGRRALALERATGTAMASAVFLGMALVAVDELGEAVAVYDRLARRTGTRGHASAGALARLSSGVCELLAGDLDTAAVSAETGLAMAAAAGVGSGLLAGHAVLARVHLHRGDVEAARAEIEAGDRHLVGPGPSMDWYLWSRAGVLEAVGDDGGYEALALAWDLTAPFRYLLAYPVLGVDLVRLAVARGDVDRALAVAAEVVTGAASSPAPAVQAAALHARGLAAGDPTLVAAAVELHGQGARRLQGAQAAEDAAALGADGAEDLLRAALATYADCGAAADARRVEAALRARGVRVARSGAAARPVSGWDSLTDAESRVVPLVASGLTTRAAAERLYVSAYTVNTHLRSIYRKLGLRSRTQLAVAWAERSDQTLK